MSSKHTRFHLPFTQRGNEKPSSVRIGLISDTHGVVCPEVLQRLHGVNLILHAGDVGHHGGHEEVLARLATLAPVYAVRGNVDDDEDDTDGEVAERYGADSVELQWDAGAGGRGVGCSDVDMAAAEVDGGGNAERTVGGGGRDPGPGGGPGPGPGGGGLRYGGHGLPTYRLLEVAGWSILMTHIVGQPPHAVEPDAAKLIARYEPHIVVFGHSHKHLALTHGSRRFYNPGSAGPARFKLPRAAAILMLPSREGLSEDENLLVEPSFSLITLAPRAPPRITSAAGSIKLSDRGGNRRTAPHEAVASAAAEPLPLPVAAPPPAFPSGVMTRSRARGGGSGNGGGGMDTAIGRRRGRGDAVGDRTEKKRVEY